MQKSFDNQLQKPNIYNHYLPYYESIQRQSVETFEEICENLSRLIQLQELQPGFPLWSSKLQQYISLYGFSFTKINHLKLINFYLSILSIENLNYVNGKICFDMLTQLTRKTRLITRDDLTIDWKLLYRWAKNVLYNHDESYSLIAMPKNIENSFLCCVRSCRPYFSGMATQEILDEFRPCLCPFDTVCGDVMGYWDMFLPVHLPPEIHNQGFKLWLTEFLDIWETVCNNPEWEQSLISLFSFAAWCNIGYIDWEPWIARIFTRILKNLSLPVGNIELAKRTQNYSIPVVATWIVAMIGNNSSCLQYLRDLLTAIKTFYHPSNTGEFQTELISFLSILSQTFVDRVYFERASHSLWYFNPPESHRLRNEEIDEFVNCLKECAFISIFNKNHLDLAAETCHYLSQLRPQLIVPPLVELLFSSIDNMIEPHRFTSIIGCLAGMPRQIVRQTPDFSQGQTFVLPLLISVLPGIDANDFKKTSITFQFLNAILMLITCVDCSSAVHTRNDLSEIEKEVCLSTTKFEDFISELLNRIFQMTDALTTEMSDAILITNESKTEDQQIGLELASTISSIVQQCSKPIFRMVREKITNFLATYTYSPKISKLLTGLIHALLKSNPVETLKYLLPQTYERIEKILSQSDTLILNDHKGDPELTWCLILFSELLCARGDTLVIYKSMIFSIFHRCIHIIHKDSHEAMAKAAKNLLKSLSYVYPIDYRLTVENIEEPFIDFLPIRAWGQHVVYDKIQCKFHIPNEEEVDFACEFVEKFIYLELKILNEKCTTMCNHERFRSLTLIHHIALGCLRMVPRIESKEVKDLVSSISSYDSKFQAQYSVYAKEPKFKENLRMRLLIDIGNLLDHLIGYHSDDASSIKTALKIYSLSSMYYGTFEQSINKSCNGLNNLKFLYKNKLCGTQQNPRFVVIQLIAIQAELFSMSNFRTLTDIDQQVIIKLFELSIHRYSEVRRQAQTYLFTMLSRFFFSYQVILDRIVELLNKPDEVDHDKIKGCLYLILGNDSIFLPSKHSWVILEKLWPSIASMKHAMKLSTQNLINCIMEKMYRRYNTVAIIEDTNEISRQAAINLWHSLDSDELELRKGMHDERNQTNICSYTNLIEKLTSLFYSDTLTCRQQIMTMTFILFLLQKQLPIPLSCIRTIVDFLIHENIDIRKIAEKCVSALCRIQKPPIIYLQKSLHEILYHINKPCTGDVCCCPGDREDNLWITINDYKPPTTQLEWEQACFLDKCFHGYYKWPKIIKYPMNKRERYTKGNMPEHVAILYNRFMDKNFIYQLIQYMIIEDEGFEINFNIHRFRMFKGLFRNFGLDLLDHFMEQLNLLIHEKAKEKQEGCHRVAAEIVAGMIRGSKYWTLEMLEELWQKLIPFLNEVCANLSPETLSYWGACFKFGMEDLDPRRMHRLIEFIRTLINGETTVNTFLETSRWFLVLKLTNFEWRVPAIWCAINEHAKEMLDHPFKAVREHIANVLSVSLSFDVKLPNGHSSRHPDANRFIDTIRERLHQAIETYEKTPLANISGEKVEIDQEARKSLNFIETVIQFHTRIFMWCLQPMKSAIIRIFPYLCELESIAPSENLTISRMYVALTYLRAPFLESLIEQLQQVCTSSKWHARRVAMEFVQHMVFCNLFNARLYQNQLHKLVFKCLFDEQFEVRTVASVTLSGFYQCGYIQVNEEDFEYFSQMSKINYFTKKDGKKIIKTENIIKRHGGILGLCAIVLSSPYDIPQYVPDALMLLCEHPHDPDLIQKSIKKALSEFRRTHHDSWHEHREKFTNDQLVILTDVLISPNYYA
ncbi:unnamed protein product [Rotaria magnacalcarata]|uniref:Proteasome activator complex subunit 4 n=3 Tax=Rotaria magnacalcarata TaxID=392030 RepID=A0A815XPD3_9BILA|nr:unnamed protein product [Rotaria magnacalcarata]CAF2131266.1 unnamed protein product [Rotaria magnacalcarata]